MFASLFLKSYNFKKAQNYFFALVKKDSYFKHFDVCFFVSYQNDIFSCFETKLQFANLITHIGVIFRSGQVCGICSSNMNVCSAESFNDIRN